MESTGQSDAAPVAPAKEAKETKQQAVEAGPIICPGHSRNVTDLSFSKVVDDRVFLASGCLDKQGMLRDGETGDWIGTFEGHNGAVWSCRLNAATDRAVTASADYTSKIFNAITGDELHTIEHKSNVRAAVFSQSGSHVYTGCSDGAVRIFDLNDVSKPEEYRGCGNQHVSYLQQAPDANLICCAAREKGVRVFDKRTLKDVHMLATEANIVSLSLSLDESTLCAAAGNSVYFWDANKFELLKKYTLAMQVSCVAVSRTAGRFVTGSLAEPWVRVHDFATGNEVLSCKGHHGPILCLAFSPNDSFASGSEDATIRIWEDLRQPARPQA